MTPSLATTPIGILADRDEMPDAKLAIQERRHREEVASLQARIKHLEAKEADAFRLACVHITDERKLIVERSRLRSALSASETRRAEYEEENARLTEIVAGDFNEQVRKMANAQVKEATAAHEKEVKSAYVRGHVAGKAEFLEASSPQQAALKKQLREAKDALLMARAQPRLPNNVVQQLTRLRLAIGSLCVENAGIPGAARLEGRDWELVDSIAAELGKAPATPAPMEKEAVVDDENNGLEID